MAGDRERARIGIWAVILTGIPQIDAVGTREAALTLKPSQLEGAFGSDSLTEGAFEGRPVGRFGCSRACCRSWAHGSPFDRSRHLLASRHVAGTGDPRSRPIRG